VLLDKLKESHNNELLTDGQVISDYMRGIMLTSDELTTVQESAILKSKGGNFEPTDPDKVLEEVQRHIFDSNWDRLIAIHKQLPSAILSYELPAGITEDNLQDRDWRLNNLYRISSKDGELIQFKLNKAQWIVHNSIKLNPKAVVLKSRQHGISTYALINNLDRALFTSHKNLGLMSQGLSESGKLFTRIQLAIKHLPSYVLPYLGISVNAENTKEVKFSNGSTIYIATSFRSATLQGLHVSELGKIAAEAPQRVAELKSGTLQTINKRGETIIESTAMGDNEFKVMWDNAVSGKSHYAPIFLNWMIDPTCVDDKALGIIDEGYFDKINYEFSYEQKAFYTNKKIELGADMFSEYPSTAEEAFSATSLGRYYETLLQKLRGNQITTHSLYDATQPLYCSADIGIRDESGYLFFQVTHEGINVLSLIYGSDMIFRDFKVEMDAYIATTNRGRLHTLYLPHDARKRNVVTGKTPAHAWMELGYKVQVIRQTNSVAQDIKVVQSYLPYVNFDMGGKNIPHLVDSLSAYSRKFVSGVWSDTPNHNVNGHSSDIPDAFRYMIFSPLVQKRKVTELAQARIDVLEAKAHRDLLNSDEKSEIIDGVLYTGDKNFWRAEVEANRKGDDYVVAQSNVTDGLDMGSGGNSKEVVDGLAI